MNLKTVLNLLISGMSRDYPELAKAVKKWSAFLLRSVEYAALVTDIAPEDILQDIMIGLCKVNDMYSTILWRYEGHLYEIVDFDGQSVLIQTSKHNTSYSCRMWVDASNLKKVERGQFESSVYREIHQKYIDILNAHHTQKNGYAEDGTAERMVVVRAGHIRSEKRKVRKVRKVVHLVDIDVPGDRDVVDPSLYPSGREIQEYLSDASQTPEVHAISDEFICGVSEGLSPEALLVLGCLLDDPGAPNWLLAKNVGLNHFQVKESRREIMRRYISFKGQPERSTEC